MFSPENVTGKICINSKAFYKSGCFKIMAG